MSDSTERTKDQALEFYRRAFWAKDRDAVSRLIAHDVRVNAPVVGEGHDAMMASIEGTFADFAWDDRDTTEFPSPAILAAEGDLVAVAFYMPQARPVAAGGGVVDYFHFDALRIVGGKVVERWPSINLSQRPTLSWASWGSGHPRPLPGARGLPAGEAKALALGFFRDVFDAHDAEAATRFVTEDYHQHVSHYPQGRVGLDQLLRQLFPDGPRPAPPAPTLPHVLFIAEGDVVVVAGLSPQVPAGGGAAYPFYTLTAYAVRDGLLAEHWSGVNAVRPPRHAQPLRPEAEGR